MGGVCWVGWVGGVGGCMWLVFQVFRCVLLQCLVTCLSECGDVVGVQGRALWEAFCVRTDHVPAGFGIGLFLFHRH